MTIMMADSKNNLFSAYIEVTDGFKSGAKLRLPATIPVTIGSDTNNDAVLYFKDSPSWKFSLEWIKDELNLEVLSGSIYYDNEFITSGKSIRIEQNKIIKTDRSSLKYIRVKKDKPIADKYCETEEYHENKVVDTTEYNYQSNSLSRNGALVCTLLAFVLLIFVVGTGESNSGIASNKLDYIENILKESEFSNLRYNVETNGSVRVHGHVDTREQYNSLRTKYFPRDYSIDYSVQVNNELSESISDIFRVNGIQAKVEIQGVGIALVKTKTSKIGLLENLKKNVKEDINTLSSLEIINTVPESTPIPEDNNSIFSNNKKIVLVSGGANGYVMTQDKSKYFIGSVLPSGHSINEIQNGSVYISLNNKITKLEF